eukprot:augustus_masked-scaffold_48-processed-gene-0.45-mRNA-1 protein AED:1.00 eAED:1.00 QI:0/-1/0/0/-1/1/1/0/129
MTSLGFSSSLSLTYIYMTPKSKIKTQRLSILILPSIISPVSSLSSSSVDESVSDWDKIGEAEGVDVEIFGEEVGASDGLVEGDLDGEFESKKGDLDGEFVGDREGEPKGFIEGDSVGSPVGSVVEEFTS